MKNSIKILFASLLIGMLALDSCKKETAATPATPLAQLWLHLHSNIDIAEIDTSAIVKDATGRQIKIKYAQMYISNIRIQKSDGSWIPMTGDLILKTIPNEQFFLGNVPTGNYQSISFNVGLDSVTNLKNPGTQPASSPLGQQNPSMWFGSTSQGYIFMNVQGLADTSAGNNGQVNMPISYQLGTNALLRTVTLPSKTYSVVANQTNFVHLIGDYGKLMQGISFKTQNMITPFSNPAVATQMANNIPGMFKYE